MNPIYCLILIMIVSCGGSAVPKIDVSGEMVSFDVWSDETSQTKDMMSPEHIEENTGYDFLSETLEKIQCVPDCKDKECGSDGCGGTCGDCQGIQSICLNGKCICKPECDGKECGPDGCGGSCGKCSNDGLCSDGKCQCIPSCAGKMCGPDGCGGSCGECVGENDQCVLGKCICKPQCKDKECGPDGCGGNCGQCLQGQTCNSKGKCVIGCIPNCIGKQCGSDGCFGTCGECDGAEICSYGVCVTPGGCLNSYPTSFGPSGKIASIATANQANIKKCFDYDQDGIGDNGLEVIADLINPQLPQIWDSGETPGIFEFKDVVDGTNTEQFTLNLLAQGSKTSQGIKVLKSSYGSDCNALIRFEKAKIMDGKLTAGEDEEIFIPIPIFPYVNLYAQKAKMKGNIQSLSSQGVTLTSGVMGGIILEDEITNALKMFSNLCQQTPMQLCDYLPYVEMILPSLKDIDTDGDGENDAISVCFLFTLNAVKIVGID